MGERVDSRALRRRFIVGLVAELHVIWPILSGLLGLVVALGVAVGAVEGWPVQDSLYFAFVTGLTIGFGDLVPTTLLTRVLAVGIGFCGILITALLAAVAVRALTDAREATEE